MKLCSWKRATALTSISMRPRNKATSSGGLFSRKMGLQHSPCSISFMLPMQANTQKPACLTVSDPFHNHQQVSDVRKAGSVPGTVRGWVPEKKNQSPFLQSYFQKREFDECVCQHTEKSRLSLAPQYVQEQKLWVMEELSLESYPVGYESAGWAGSRGGAQPRGLP